MHPDLGIPVLHSPAHYLFIYAAFTNQTKKKKKFSVRSAPFSAEPVRKSRITPPGDARQVFWVVPTSYAFPAGASELNCAAIDGTYSSGNCCRLHGIPI